MAIAKKRICCSATLLFVCLCFELIRPLHAMLVDTNSSAQASILETSTKAQFTRAAAYREITDIDCSTNVTKDQVIAVWGAPDAYAGTNDFFEVYRLEDRLAGNQDQEVWLGFEASPPYRLAAFRSMPPAAKVVPKKPVRKLSDLTIANGITYEQVTAVWGRPESFPSTGISYCSYPLENGQQVWFEFNQVPPCHALSALLVDQKGTIKDLFSSTQEIFTNIPIKRAATNRNDFDIVDTDLLTHHQDFTQNQVIAVWGPPDAYASTNNFFEVYYVGDKEVWLAFDSKPPHFGVDCATMPPAAKVVPERRTRKMSELTITNGITYEQVTAVWGRPDYFPPTGVEYFSYLIDQGQEVWFEFDYKPPYRALIATLFDKKGTRRHLF